MRRSIFCLSSNFLRSSASYSLRSIPLRAPKVPKKTTNEAPIVRLVPYLPPEHIRDTIRFLDKKDTQTGLLELIFNPTPDKTQEIPYEDRLEFQIKLEKYLFQKEQYLKTFRQHEATATAAMWKAIKELPEDLHDEAVKSDWRKLPDDLVLNLRFKKQYFEDRTLSDREMKKLQIFQNLMHVRFPHKVVKMLKPERFWIRENMAISRQKQAAMRNAKARMKKK